MISTHKSVVVSDLVSDWQESELRIRNEKRQSSIWMALQTLPKLKVNPESFFTVVPNLEALSKRRNSPLQ